ncbi:hypothetical protein CC2G_008037 [Coprinopsis cinerea AmutBmut pab1-1]|nr:hypothetical protein CC2G_008037 [Coprinopsis cinerea AmutBmut pab1-1]
MSRILISPYDKLLSHSRFLLQLRSQENVYSALILFRLSSSADTKAYNDEGDLIKEAENGCPSNKLPPATENPSTTTRASPDSPYSQIYVMESACPHLGADMSHADIEECETGAIAVCPWHRYDFDLRTGKSETGLQACTYRVEVETDPVDGVDKVYMEAPKGGTGWKVVELRPVSEEFADPPPKKPEGPTKSLDEPEKEDEPVVPVTNPPKTLMQWAVLILNTPNPRLKVERTKHAVHLFRTGKLSSIGHKSPSAPRPPDVPSREETYSRNVVDPSKVKNRRNRAAMLHALANIEQWAIDLAYVGSNP